MSKLYGVLAQIHMLVSEMANTNKIFGPAFVSCVSLENHSCCLCIYGVVSFSIQHMSCLECLILFGLFVHGNIHAFQSLIACF